MFMITWRARGDGRRDEFSIRTEFRQQRGSPKVFRTIVGMGGSGLCFLGAVVAFVSRPFLSL